VVCGEYAKGEKVSKELLAVLDMAEKEQRKVMGNYVVKKKSHDVKCLDWTGTPCRHCGKKWKTWGERRKDKSVCKGPFVYKGSLADLAFRLRDEAVKIVNKYEYPTQYLHGMEMVYKKATKTKGVRHDPKIYREAEEWFSLKAQPIHFIIAALIAKEQSADRITAAKAFFRKDADQIVSALNAQAEPKCSPACAEPSGELAKELGVLARNLTAFGPTQNNKAAAIARQAATRIQELEKAMKAACHCVREELIQWLKENKVVSDQPFEKEKTIVLRMMVIQSSLHPKAALGGQE
jgi:hypothetical protein